MVVAGKIVLHFNWSICCWWCVDGWDNGELGCGFFEYDAKAISYCLPIVVMEMQANLENYPLP